MPVYSRTAHKFSVSSEAATRAAYIVTYVEHMQHREVMQHVHWSLNMDMVKKTQCVFDQTHRLGHFITLKPPNCHSGDLRLGSGWTFYLRCTKVSYPDIKTILGVFKETQSKQPGCEDPCDAWKSSCVALNPSLPTCKYVKLFYLQIINMSFLVDSLMWN